MPSQDVGGLKFWVGTDEEPAPRGTLTNTEPTLRVSHELQARTAVRLVLEYRLNGGDRYRIRFEADRRDDDQRRHYIARFPPLTLGTRVDYIVEARLRVGGRQRTYRVAEHTFDVQRERNSPASPVRLPVQIRDRVRPDDLGADDYAGLSAAAVQALEDRLEEVLGPDTTKKLDLGARIAKLSEDDRFERRELVTLIRQKLKDDEKRNALKRLRALPKVIRLADTLRPDVEVASNSLVSRQLDRSAAEKLIEVAGLPGDANAATREVLLDRLSAPRAVNRESLASEVRAGRLDANQAERLGLGANLYALLEGEIEPVAKLVESLANNGMGATRLRDLARLTREEVARVLADSGAIADEGERQRVSFELRGALEHLYPGTAMIHANIAAADVASAVPERGQRPADGAREKLAARFPGLGIDTILEEDDGTIERVEIRHRIDAKLRRLADFERANEHVDLLTHDLSGGGHGADELDFGDADEGERNGFVRLLKSYQRAHRLGGNIDTATTLLEAGLSSAADVARLKGSEDLGAASRAGALARRQAPRSAWKARPCSDKRRQDEACTVLNRLTAEAGSERLDFHFGGGRHTGAFHRRKQAAHGFGHVAVDRRLRSAARTARRYHFWLRQSCGHKGREQLAAGYHIESGTFESRLNPAFAPAKERPFRKAASQGKHQFLERDDAAGTQKVTKAA